MQMEKNEASVPESEPMATDNTTTVFVVPVSDTQSPVSDNKPSTQVMAAEGFLAICGGCGVLTEFILFSYRERFCFLQGLLV